MRITKSMLKNLVRCPRYYNFFLSNLEKTSIDNEKILDLLEESNLDIDCSDYDIDKLDAMNHLYLAVELETSKAVTTLLNGFNRDSSSINGQEMFSSIFTDIELYCYTDIVNTSSNCINIIEVKSCTNTKLKKLGPTIDGEIHSIFTRSKNIYYLKEEKGSYFPISDSKYISNREKLFNKYDSFGKYVYDLSIQRYIIEHSKSYKKNKNYSYFLAMLNKDYVFDGTYENEQPVYKMRNNQELINFVDLTKITQEMQSVIQNDFDTIKDYIKENDNTYSKLGKYCMRNKITECKFLKHCSSYLTEEDIIADLSGISYKKISEFHEKGKTYISDLESGDIKNQKQLTEIDVILNNKEWIDKESIENELNQLKYPLYHLDFETFTSPLPRFKGETPNDVYTFQFSVHVERSPEVCDIDKDHKEFLAKDHNDYRELIAKKLVDIIDLSVGGTVITWNKGFEISRLKELAQSVPQYSNELYNIIDHVYDLMDMFKGKKGTNIFAYRKAMKGSFSIKYVLPAYTELSYDDMDIGNGLLAMAAYASYPKLTKKQHTKLVRDLTNYCKQDTWAMVKLLSEIRTLTYN